MTINERSILPIDSILDKINSGFFVLASDWTIVYVNHAIELFVGKQRQDLIGNHLWETIPDLIPFNHYYHKAMSEKASMSFEEYYDPTGRWCKVTLEPYQNGLVGYVCDYTEAKDKELMIQHMADHDELTDLPNRRFFEKELEAVLESSPSFVLMYLDIDRFKMVNDALGHDVGDQLITKFGDRLRSHVSPNDFVARLGSDVFGIILNRPENPEAAVKNLKQFMESRPFCICDTELYLTVRLGVSLYPEHGGDSETLLKKANLALYHTKAQGGNVIQFYNRDVDMDFYKRLTLEKGLREAISANQLALYYQPRVDACTGEICSFEALVRWKHPEWGIVSPGEFIQAAEDTGLIHPLSYWVKRTAIQQLKQWQDEGTPLVPISVNISAQCFLAEKFLHHIKDLLEELQIEGKWLEIEITENAILNNEKLVALRIKELKRLGVNISIDDFGTGYSSLAYLSHYNVDVLKVDKSFIYDVASNPSNQIITKAIIDLAHGLGMAVVAEGVETVEQLAFLRELSCDQIQGYLYSKPVPDTQLAELLKRRKLVPDTN